VACVRRDRDLTRFVRARRRPPPRPTVARPSWAPTTRRERGNGRLSAMARNANQRRTPPLRGGGRPRGSVRSLTGADRRQGCVRRTSAVSAGLSAKWLVLRSSRPGVGRRRTNRAPLTAAWMVRPSGNAWRPTRPRHIALANVQLRNRSIMRGVRQSDCPILLPPSGSVRTSAVSRALCSGRATHVQSAPSSTRGSAVSMVSVSVVRPRSRSRVRGSRPPGPVPPNERLGSAHDGVGIASAGAPARSRGRCEPAPNARRTVRG
jgi:hypothetical protein